MTIDAAAPPCADPDILNTNAAIARLGLALHQAERAWDDVLHTNLKGLFFLSRAAGCAMKAHGRGGSIINIASVSGLRQAIGLLPYHVSKAGVIQLTMTLALKHARHGVRVNAIARGSFRTDELAVRPQPSTYILVSIFLIFLVRL